ncbi:hypothetical protein A2634_04685 [Candidatus Amesbacteria bacterium RIFCSPHIGHO2_01_FULL_48_32]|uniref:ROK family protein n=1 Tax=Candidatus Amesbacteria bacterium RIFCSPLOWO2_01_FULL_48_25 TaxID=1797259 RepID=A0A1F4ZCC5_9BACT|nr:MAG: hypothetical protein A2634_04685 [Candidatus Amesbacteria bacterium RIFCSPHIGHO2_01_FULL_48_32]OGD03835.1 MAG: hypothetical protein A2989_04160 [Candidatus Amesbacteria bacterium RIFCSPLOWO2_01_FULL_48_25]HJZ05471.1 ROK family protein [Patescibacteria group bacterium]
MKVVFDVGGSHMRVGVSADGGELVQVTDVVTPVNPEEGMLTLVDMAKRMVGEEKITAVAGGVAGVWNAEKSKILGSPNLTSWVDFPIKEKLQAMWGVEVRLENDAALGALGEAVYGAGKNKQIVAYLAVGTGVGGARIVNGKIDENNLGFEPGHQYIGESTLEELVGGRSLEKKYGKRAEDITDAAVWEEVARHLAVGVVNTILLWSPHIVVMGGSVIRSIPWEKMIEEVSSRLKVYPWVPMLVRRSLGEKAGLYGGLALLGQDQGGSRG